MSGVPPSRHAKLADLVVRLWYDIDHNEGANAHAFFTRDAELRFDNATFRGSAEIKQVYADRAERGERVSRHLVTNVHITSARRGRVCTTSNLLLFGQDGVVPRPSTSPALIADVHDEFVRRRFHWLIASRHIEYLFIAPTTELAVPSA